MEFEFTETLPQNYATEIRIISGSDSLDLNGKEYLLIKNEQAMVSIFEIRYEYHCSPFKEALITGNILAVGHEEHFYLYDLDNNDTFYKLKVSGYFGHLYFNDNLFFVTDASGIHCIDKAGMVTWTNESLAMDGVIINNFEGDQIYGSAELDPPGGWEDFVISLSTGKVIG